MDDINRHPTDLSTNQQHGERTPVEVIHRSVDQIMLRNRFPFGSLRFVKTTQTPDGPVLSMLKRLSPAQVDAELADVRRQKTELETYEALLQLVRGLASGEGTNGETVKTKPSLKNAIRAVLMEDPSLGWRPAQLYAELESRNWTPNSKTAKQQLQGRLTDMLADGELVRDADSYYYLSSAAVPSKDLRRATS